VLYFLASGVNKVNNSPNNIVRNFAFSVKPGKNRRIRPDAQASQPAESPVSKLTSRGWGGLNGPSDNSLRVGNPATPSDRNPELLHGGRQISPWRKMHCIRMAPAWVNHQSLQLSETQNPGTPHPPIKAIKAIKAIKVIKAPIKPKTPAIKANQGIQGSATERRALLCEFPASRFRVPASAGSSPPNSKQKTQPLKLHEFKPIKVFKAQAQIPLRYLKTGERWDELALIHFCNGAALLGCARGRRRSVISPFVFTDLV